MEISATAGSSQAPLSHSFPSSSPGKSDTEARTSIVFTSATNPKAELKSQRLTPALLQQLLSPEERKQYNAECIASAVGGLRTVRLPRGREFHKESKHREHALPPAAAMAAIRHLAEAQPGTPYKQ